MTTEEGKQQASEVVTQGAEPGAPTADELVDGLGKRDECDKPRVAMTLRERAAAWWRGEDAPDPSVPVLAPGTTSANA
jgi:hypothetical protein